MGVAPFGGAGFHNMHHERVTTHFGEISSLWDFLCGTADIYDAGLRAGVRWHLEKHILCSERAAKSAAQ